MKNIERIKNFIKTTQSLGFVIKLTFVILESIICFITCIRISYETILSAFKKTLILGLAFFIAKSLELS